MSASAVEAMDIRRGLPRYGMRQMTVTIGPKEAAEMLEGNKANRPISGARVSQFARTMANGMWRLSPQGIVMTRDGRLLDGQHRLHAVVQSGATIEAVIWYDVPDETFRVLDTGRPRAAHFVLEVSRSDVAVARLVYQLFGPPHGQGLASVEEINQIVSWLRPHLDQVEQATYRRASKRGTAPIRLACIARMLNGQGKHALPTYRALTHLDLRAMPPIIGAFIRQMDRGKIGVSQGTLDLLARSWVAFDPERQDNDSLVIKDIENQLAEVLAVLTRNRPSAIKKVAAA